MKTYVACAKPIAAALFALAGLAAAGVNADSSSALNTFDGPAGGHVFYGLVPNATSAESVFRSGMQRARGFFDAAPVLRSAVRSKDGHLVLAVFTATKRGSRVGGLVVATYETNGASRIAVLSDRVEALPKSIGPMTRSLPALVKRELAPLHSGTGAVADVPLESRAFPDGTGTIGVAPGFTVRVMQGGRFSAVGEDGSYINLGNPIGMLDPNGTMYRQMIGMASRSGSGMPLPQGTLVVPYSNDLAVAWVQARREMARQNGVPDPEITISASEPLASPPGSFMQGVNAQGTQTVNGTRMKFIATFFAGPRTPDGSWQIFANVLSAPLVNATRELPVLFAMQRSERLDMAALTAQTNAAIQASAHALAQSLSAQHAAYMQLSDENFHHVMARAQAQQTSIDRSAAGFSEYINGTTWVHDSVTGRDEHADQAAGYALVKNDPTRFTELPIQQYRAGAQY